MRRAIIFGHPIPEAFADKLARRAEGVFAHQPFWQRKYQSARGREYILMSMRHWLAGVLARERPALSRALPESFKIGKPLPSSDLRTPSPVRRAKDMPEKPPGGAAAPPYHKHKMVGTPRCGVRTSQRDVPTKPRFVHGCELLMV